MTRKIDEKKWGKAMTGTLFQFSKVFGDGSTKEWSLGSFTGNLIRYGRGVDNLKNSIYYFATGAKGGGGTLTPAMAADAVFFIRTAITSGNRKMYKGPPMAPLNKDYGHWKKYGVYAKYRDNHLMTLTGATASAITARKDTKAGASRMSVTLDPSVKAPHPLTGQPSNVKVTDYAYGHEYPSVRKGSVQRPIISGAMAAWIAIRSPAWSRAFERLMYDVLWDPEQKSTHGKRMEGLTFKEGDIIETSKGTGEVSYGGAQNAVSLAAESLSKAAKVLGAFGETLLKQTAQMSKGKVLTPEQEKAADAVLRNELRSSNLPEIVIDAVIKRALQGKEIDEDML